MKNLDNYKGRYKVICGTASHRANEIVIIRHVQCRSDGLIRLQTDLLHKKYPSFRGWIGEYNLKRLYSSCCNRKIEIINYNNLIE